MVPLGFEPRELCSRCRRPSRVCYCAHLPALTTRTRVVILQHPRERDVPIGTGHMASLCLPDASLHVGLALPDRYLQDPARPPVLLYPGEGAIDVNAHPPAGPVTLVVVDGTWSQAKKLVRISPTLRALPRYAFAPPRPSEYRIRKEPSDEYVSTIEALVHVLGALERDAGRFAALLDPFRAMVAMQVAHAGTGGGRKRTRRAPRAPKSLIPRILVDRAADLVCVYGEANAWPYGSKERATVPDELLHWVAMRPSTGESFDALMLPHGAMSPATPRHVALNEASLASGMRPEDLEAHWRGFIRATDVVCTWGTYAAKLFLRAGGVFPTVVDLRKVARASMRERVGTLEDATRKLSLPPSRPAGRGRAGLRLGQLVSVAEALAEAGDVGARKQGCSS